MRKPSVAVLFLTVLVDLLGFGIVLPLLPRYAHMFDESAYKVTVAQTLVRRALEELTK